MSTFEVREMELPALRLAVRTTTVPDQPSVAGVVGPLFDALEDAVGPDIAGAGPGFALYDMGEFGVQVTTGFAYDGEPGEGFEILEIPAARGLAGVHHGTMAGIGESWRLLHTAVLERGYVPAWPGREVYLRAESEDQLDWITELQQPVKV